MLPIPRVPGATERARHQNDRTRELLKFVYVNRRCLACESRESRASAVLLLLLTSRCTHASESWPATGVSPLASATRWGSTPQRVCRRSNHRDLSRTIRMASVRPRLLEPLSALLTRVECQSSLLSHSACTWSCATIEGTGDIFFLSSTYLTIDERREGGGVSDGGR